MLHKERCVLDEMLGNDTAVRFEVMTLLYDDIILFYL